MRVGNLVWENLSGTDKKKKTWQVTHIAPLQPNILAAFLPWGSSSGAGRIRLADAKVAFVFYKIKKRTKK